MHGLDVDVDVRRDVPRRADVPDHVAGANPVPRRWSMFVQSGAVAGSSRRLNAAKASLTSDHVSAWAAASPAR